MILVIRFALPGGLISSYENLHLLQKNEEVNISRNFLWKPENANMENKKWAQWYWCYLFVFQLKHFCISFCTFCGSSSWFCSGAECAAVSYGENLPHLAQSWPQSWRDTWGGPGALPISWYLFQCNCLWMFPYGNGPCSLTRSWFHFPAQFSFLESFPLCRKGEDVWKLHLGS